MSWLRAPDSWPWTFRSEISQAIARRRVGNFCVDQKEKSAPLAKVEADVLTLDQPATGRLPHAGGRA
jgi:hypothetical protein